MTEEKKKIHRWMNQISEYNSLSLHYHMGGLCLGVSVWGSLFGGLFGGSLFGGSLSGGSLSREDLCLEGLCPEGGLCLGVSVQGGVSLTETLFPPVNRMTHRCKNITLPQLRCGR